MDKTIYQRCRAAWKQRSRGVMAALLGSLLVGAATLFWKLAEQIDRGLTRPWDERILLALRRADDPAIPIGPHWLHEAGLDVTALGSPIVLAIFVVASVGFLYFEGQRRVAAVTAAMTIGGGLLSVLLKSIFARPRPEVVPHLRDVLSSSFPSGHTMGAAIVYMTLGVMFMKSFRSRRAQAFCLLLALFLTVAVGLSRVYLGVHYPSDVLGGWLAALSWTLACWSLAHFIPNRPLPEVDDAPTKPSQADRSLPE